MSINKNNVEPKNEEKIEVKPASMAADYKMGEQSPDTTEPTAIEVVESVVGPVSWITDVEGYCACPGKQFHTTHNGRQDCKLYLDKVPTLYCFHGSCKGELEAANTKLRMALLNGKLGDKPRLTSEDKKRLREREQKEAKRRRAATSKPRILREFTWPYAEILQDSLLPLPENPAEHWRSLLACFHLNDVVWIGDTYSSGKPEHQRNFRLASDWLTERAALAQFTCPATFKAGSYARSNLNVSTRRFLVVESDVLGRDQVGAIFRWMKEQVGMNLRAVVDTAGKSLHAWFDYPPASIVEDLKIALPELGCDPKLFTASQPVRLPGALRDGKYQKLIYLGKEVA